ncbi:MAG TPA: hypothetical protein DHW71_13010 [Gammaproteobacteria bacterium]|nr:hypothetical protein [Gammaproteobacteria bacterium]HBF07070.1 hypothetical protein [Gammaproteobacteria bacterium]HCK93911.1 hypothetical protein [Gammaproteobacteria bacterium]|tara:strand:+ start:148 stop:1161 length:1014 start_codon:yes stop_codon:yes gene_type:complete
MALAPIHSLGLSLPEHTPFLDHNQTLSRLEEGINTDILRLNTIREPSLRAPNENQIGSILRNANFHEVNIGGHDNNCWLRGSWFSVIRQHSMLNSMDHLENRVRELLDNCQDPDVEKFKARNDNPTEQAFSILNHPDNKTNASLNRAGYFAKPVEDLVFHTTIALLSQSDELKTEKFLHFFNKNIKPENKPRSFIGANSLYQRAIFNKLDANAAKTNVTPKSFTSVDSHQVDVHWLGNEKHHQKQLDTILFARQSLFTEFGHLSVFASENDHKFTYAPHYNQPPHEHLQHPFEYTKPANFNLQKMFGLHNLKASNLLLTSIFIFTLGMLVGVNIAKK